LLLENKSSDNRILGFSGAERIRNPRVGCFFGDLSTGGLPRGSLSDWFNRRGYRKHSDALDFRLSADLAGLRRPFDWCISSRRLFGPQTESFAFWGDRATSSSGGPLPSTLRRRAVGVRHGGARDSILGHVGVGNFGERAGGDAAAGGEGLIVKSGTSFAADLWSLCSSRFSNHFHHRFRSRWALVNFGALQKTILLGVFQAEKQKIPAQRSNLTAGAVENPWLCVGAVGPG